MSDITPSEWRCPHGYTDLSEDLCFCGWIIHSWLVDKRTGKIVETCPGNEVIAYFGFRVNEGYIKDLVRSIENYPLTEMTEGFWNATLKNSQVLAEASRMGI